MRWIKIGAAVTSAGLALGAFATLPDAVATEPDDGVRMGILTTPEDVRFRVTLGKPGGQLRARPVQGAMGWSTRLAKTKDTLTTWPTPATDGERVYVGGHLGSNEFFAVNAENGALWWRARLTDNGPTPAVVRDRRVYFNTQSCTLYAYDARTGRRLWSNYLASRLESIPTVAAAGVLSARPSGAEGAGGPMLSVVEGKRGKVVADISIDGDAFGAPVVRGDNAYLATKKGTLYCVDLDKGEERWSDACGARGAPWVDESGVYVVGKSTVEAFNATTGARRYAYAPTTPSARTPNAPKHVTPPTLRKKALKGQGTDTFWGDGVRPVVAAGKLVLAEGKALRVFEKATALETAWWELDVTAPFCGTPIVAGGTVVVATKNGEVRAVDIERGEIVWAVDITDAKLGSGIILDDAKMYAVTTDGRLVMVETGDLRADGWPMWGGTADRTPTPSDR